MPPEPPNVPGPHGRTPAASYRALQTGYREALLAQLDFAITEMLEEGDFPPEQVTAAVELRLSGRRGVLRHHKLAEEW